ncbi:hypothetical protein CJJ23_01090, partial [Mycoplasmopsis agassizii]
MKPNILKLIEEEIKNDNVRMLKLDDVATIKVGKSLTRNHMNNEYQFPVMSGGFKPTGYYDKWNYENIIVIAKDGQAGFVTWMNQKFWAANGCFVVETKNDQVLTKYLFYILKLKEPELMAKKQGSIIQHLYKKPLGDTIIPLPSFSLQTKIVEILDEFTSLEAELEARNKQYNYYLNHLLNFEGKKGRDVDFITIEKLCNIRKGYTPSKKEKSFWSNGSFPWFRMEDLRLSSSRIINDSIQHITLDAIRGNNYFKANSIIIATTATIGEHALITTDYLANDQFKNLEIKDEFKELITPKFLFYYSFLLSEFCKQNINNSAFPSVQMDEFKQFKIAIPPLEEQNRIVNILDEFSRLEAELEAELEARNKQYNYYLHHLLNFEGEKADNVEFLKLGEITEIKAGKHLTLSQMSDNFKYPVMGGGSKITGYYNDYNSENSIAIARVGQVGSINWMGFKFWAISTCFRVKSVQENINIKYLYYFLKTKEYEIVNQRQQSAIPNINKGNLEEIIVPVPPLEEQNRIVNILDKFSKLTSDINEGLPAEIKMRRQQY